MAKIKAAFLRSIGVRKKEPENGMYHWYLYHNI
ncbi:MAG: hypothetical protein ACI8WB_004513 [Phenylobacterium sp.]|jgi:hypothetical protein